jgi:peptidoglycan/xylan/chitin deacetylase (PgdA/CDA1 family)
LKQFSSNQLLGLFFAMASLCLAQSKPVGPMEKNSRFVVDEGATIRGDQTTRELAIVFTGDEFGDGAETIIKVLKQQGVKASFFFTGRFYRNPDFKSSIQRLKRDGHYLGAHSDQHLLYCDWTRRDELLVSREQFADDLNKNYAAMQAFGIAKNEARYFLPPFEWYNRSISNWTEEMGLRLINFTPGTRSNADYTTPDQKNYVSSEAIMRRISEYETRDPAGLNGFIFLMHIGVAQARTDKFYDRLDDLIGWLRTRKYQLVRIDRLLKAGDYKHSPLR